MGTLEKHSWFFVLLGNILLIFLNQLVSEWMSPFGLYLYVDSLLIMAPILLLSYTGGFWVVVLSGLFIDAMMPIPYGMHAILYLVAYNILYGLEHYYNGGVIKHARFSTLITNTALMLLLAVLIGRSLIFSAVYWLNFVINIGLSSLIMLAINQWFYALQTSIVKSLVRSKQLYE